MMSSWKTHVYFQSFNINSEIIARDATDLKTAI